MNKTLKRNILLTAACLCLLPAAAQLSQNPNKFLGNITTRGQIEAGGGVPKYYTLWNQVTCENESKWASVEGTRGTFNWGGADNAFNYAKQHDFTHKFHALVWGSQYPGWLESLSPRERFAAMTNWFDHAKEHYGELPMIDVVNEAVGNHQAGNAMMKETLGGGGKTGYDWLIKAFDMAAKRWPDAILIYNDYNSIRWDVDNYITLVQTLRDAGAPIDAYGNQSHELGDISATELSNVLKKQQDALQMPMFITELDIDKADDQQQKAQYEKILPLMWEAPYCAGVTLWGYVLGATWVDNSGLYRNGKERPAMTWIREYMQTDAARNAPGPLPGARKEASVYIRPAALKIAKDDVMPVKVHARMATKTIEKVELYANGNLVAAMTEAPYLAEFKATTVGKNTLKAVVTATDGTTYERYSQVTVARGTSRKPYNDAPFQLPGTIDAMEYDEGLSGVAYSNASRTLATTTKDNQWMEYTVDVEQDGYYSLGVEIASAKEGGRFHLSEYGLDELVFYTDFLDVPNTGSTTNFQTVQCPLKQKLTAGRHVFCLNVEKGGFCVKSLTFKHIPTFDLPGVVENEFFLKGGDGLEVGSGNGGSVLSCTNATGWVEYAVNVVQSGKYSYKATVSSAVDNAKFAMTLIDDEGNETSLGNVTVPNTGSKDTYAVKEGNIRNKFQKEGPHTIRLTIVNAGCNIDKMEFICTEPASGIASVADDEAADAPACNLVGIPVGDGYRGFVIKNGKKYIKR